MDKNIRELLLSFESSSKDKKKKYNDFLIHVYMTFEKKILLCKKDKEINKYKKMRNSVLSYILVNERTIKSKICK